jgi:hypothetical protein
MFLFNSLHQGNRKASRSPAFALAVMFCLSTALLVTGCNTEPDHVDTGFIPLGEWGDGYGSYIITNTDVVFDDGFGYGDFTGIIQIASDFSADSGVLIIKVTSSNVGYTVDKFTGVYYKDYTASHVFLANAVDELYAPIEKDTLTEAKKTFTVDNVDTHVTYWGTGYNK